ncbi:hypothetical protein BT93_E2427 [Corymbia citriodora subsp. variegata]|nr:hypothetical protein BT93_E2427 [Corymbia citriodora subsp. variegata]
MPSHVIDSSSPMVCTLNENVPSSGPTYASMSSFQNGYNDATAWSSLVPSQTICFRNPMEFSANGCYFEVPRGFQSMDCLLNENVLSSGPLGASISSFQNGYDGLASLASHQSTFANNCNSLISSGGLPEQFHGINVQYAMPSRTVNQNVLPSGSTSASISNFQCSGTLPVRGGNAVSEGMEPDLPDGNLQGTIPEMWVDPLTWFMG